jgi:hypothetical protein
MLMGLEQHKLLVTRVEPNTTAVQSKLGIPLRRSACTRTHVAPWNMFITPWDIVNALKHVTLRDQCGPCKAPIGPSIFVLDPAIMPIIVCNHAKCPSVLIVIRALCMVGGA